MIVVLAEALAEALPVQIVIAEPPALLDSFGCEANVDGNARSRRQAFLVQIQDHDVREKGVLRALLDNGYLADVALRSTLEEPKNGPMPARKLTRP